MKVKTMRTYGFYFKDTFLAFILFREEGLWDCANFEKQLQCAKDWIVDELARLNGFSTEKPTEICT